jgi:hypothetical protein
MPRRRRNENMASEGSRGFSRSHIEEIIAHQRELDIMRLEVERQRALMNATRSQQIALDNYNPVGPFPSYVLEEPVRIRQSRDNPFQEEIQVNHEIINLDKYHNEICLQIREYQERNRCRPQYLKVNKRAIQILIYCEAHRRNGFGAEIINEYMGLKVCTTDDIDLQCVEVF